MGEFGKSFQVNRIEVSVASGGNVYGFLSEKESDTDGENSKPAERQMHIHTGRVQEEKQAVEPSQRLQRENTWLKITRHQNETGTDALNVPKHTKHRQPILNHVLTLLNTLNMLNEYVQCV